MSNITGQTTSSPNVVGVVSSDGVHISAGVVSGARGKSAYEIWLEQGNVGSESDFLNSFKATDANYVHDQISSAKEWRIIHNLEKYPSVSIVDTGGNMVVGEVHYVSINEVIISFTFEFSGKAYLN